MTVESYTPRISNGVSIGLLGAWLVSFVLLILILSGIVSGGEITALTMFSGATGILSSAMLERLAFSRQQKHLSSFILIVNAILTTFLVFRLGLTFL